MQLPVVVVHRVDLFLRSRSQADEVIAAYLDRLLIVRLQTNSTLPAEVFNPATGAAALLSLRLIERPIDLPWESVDWVESHSVTVPKPSTTFVLRGPGVRKKIILDSEQPGPLLEVLAEKLAGRLVATADSAERSRSKIRTRTAIVAAVWAGITLFLLEMLKQVQRGLPAPREHRARLLWSLLSFMFRKLGYWPTSLIITAFGVALLLASVRVIQEQASAIMAEDEPAP